MSDERAGAGRISESMSMRGLAGKRDYVRSLESRRDEESLSLLVGCLGEESWYLRELAESALLKIGDRCGPALLPLLGQGLWFSRSSAARVLGRIAHVPAAGPLVKLTFDRVETVVGDAYAALILLASQGGSARVAWELLQLEPERRGERLDRLLKLDRALGERLLRLQQLEPLKSRTDGEGLRDDAPWVRASEEGVEWDVIPSPPPVRPAAPHGKKFVDPPDAAANG